jgi:ABC-type oligopeptide transport system ATPase subunit
MHEHSFPTRRSSDLAVMDEGRIVEQGTMEKIIAAPAHPASRRLVAASL